MKYLWALGLLSLLACNRTDPTEEELSPLAEPRATYLSEAEIERLSNSSTRYTLDDNEIVASLEGIQGSLDELNRKTSQFEADIQRIEQVSDGTASLNLSPSALQQLAKANQELTLIQQQLDNVRKTKAEKDYTKAANQLRQINRRIRYAELLYTEALTDENVKTAD